MDLVGFHIASLILRFFLLYMPQIIQAGKLYKAVPPLYSIPKRGGGEEYFTRSYDFVKYIQKLYLSNNKVSKINNQNFGGKEATIFFMNNEDYVYWLERLANTYAVEPLLLEMALFNQIRGTKLTQIQKDLKKMYRFMDVKDVNGTRVFSGTIKESNTLFMNEQMIKDCQPMINIINKNGDNWYYIVNGKQSSLYEVMKGFEKTQPNHLQRYKGLGEMDYDQIAESTILPDITVPIKLDGSSKPKMVTGNRTLIRYTVEDVKEEVEVIRKYESDYSQLFSMVGKVTRQDLID